MVILKGRDTFRSSLHTFINKKSPSPQGAEYITVTQDMSPSDVAEVCN